MFGILNKTRKPYGSSLVKQAAAAFFMLLFGCGMGILTVFTENLSDSYIPSFLGWLEPKSVLLRFAVWIFTALCIAVFSKSPLKAGINVLSFFAGALAAYCVSTQVVTGGFPSPSVLMPRIIFAAVSAVAALLCWYARGRGALAVGISSVLIAVLCALAFNLNVNSFGVQHWFEFILWLACIGVLFRSWQQSLYSFLISIPVAFALEYTGILSVIGIG